MERESFESEEIGRLLNDSFVSIKVDREERPDVDRVYMTFVQVCAFQYMPLNRYLCERMSVMFRLEYVTRVKF